MGRRKNKKKERSNTRTEGNGERKNYDDIIKENSSFEIYYKLQNIVPNDEWEKFMLTLKESLPAAFRITGYKGEAGAMKNIIQGKYFEDLLKVNVEGVMCEKPFCLPWYPNGLAWQLKLSRVIIRKTEAYGQLHNFLISETDSGNISRQEAVSMIPPILLEVEPHHKVLDMCAAPGSKTAQLIEMLHREEGKIPDGVIVANDLDNKRCYMLVHQAKRLNSPCFIITNTDAAQMSEMLIKQKDGTSVPLRYDRVLCDVPCSGDGTIRKNIDIWTKWNPANGNNLHGLQFRIAKRGADLLKEGGRMVYSTCSLNPIEDEAVVAALLQQSQGGLKLIDVSEKLPGLKYCKGLYEWKVTNRDLNPIESPLAIPEKQRTQIRMQLFPPTKELAEQMHLEYCLRILPHQQDTGGFFVAVFEKTTENISWTDKSKSNAGNPVKEGTKANTDDNDKGSKSPPRKKKKVYGHREDPFIFLKDDDDIWLDIKNFYEPSDTFPCSQLLTRCATGKKRNLYFVSEQTKEIVESNSDQIKIINTGVRLLSRTENKDTVCHFRLTQEGLPTILPFLHKRIYEAKKEDLVLLLTEDVTVLTSFSKLLQEKVAETESGCIIVTHLINEGTDAECKLTLSCWKGKSSLRCYVPKEDRYHYLRMLGEDVSILEKREKTYKNKLETAGASGDSETKETSV